MYIYIYVCVYIYIYICIHISVMRKTRSWPLCLPPRSSRTRGWRGSTRRLLYYDYVYYYYYYYCYYYYHSYYSYAYYYHYCVSCDLCTFCSTSCSTSCSTLCSKSLCPLLVTWRDLQHMILHWHLRPVRLLRVWISEGWELSCPLNLIGSLRESSTRGLLVGKLLVGGLGVPEAA